MLMMIQFMMVTMMVVAITSTDDYVITVTGRPTLAVKFPCAIALHFYLFPEVEKGMKIMKFANNNPELFDKNGSQLAYLIGLVQLLLAIYTEFVNIYLLSYQHTVDHCIIHFVALEVIMELAELYLESLSDEGTTEVLHH